MALNSSDALLLHLQNSINDFIRQITDELVKETTKEFERRLRTSIGVAAVSLTNQFSVQQLSNELVIRVQIEPKG